MTPTTLVRSPRTCADPLNAPFNDWDPTATFLVGGNGMCRASVVMGAGRRYAFRYLAQGRRWFNDQTADDYQPNEFGGSDSVVDVTGSAGTTDPLATRRGPPRARVGTASDTGELTMR